MRHVMYHHPTYLRRRSGRLSDILGRKGAMLLALSLFGSSSRSAVNRWQLTGSFRFGHPAVWPGTFDGCPYRRASNSRHGRGRVSTFVRSHLSINQISHVYSNPFAV